MANFSKLLLSWFDLHGRKDLPWQQDKTPYRVWVSEVMLQQTQVSAVIGYFQRFMNKFPDIQSLANAQEDAVLHLWTGLGYYSRARNLHRTARIIAQDYQGQFPSTLDALQSLPGIGRSTAGAISAIAFTQPTAILDGNVKRVLSRLYGITEWPGEKKVTDQLWKIAQDLTPQKRPDDYTQAIMDLGATLCTRSKPRCTACPVETLCVARKLGIEKTLPHSKPKKTLPLRQTTFLILQHNEKILLEKRPATGVWGNLWSLPETAESSPDRIKTTCHQRFQLNIKNIACGEVFRHTFSHFHLDILPAHITLETLPRKIMDSEQQIWYNLRQPQTVGLPKPVKTLLDYYYEEI